MNVHAIAVVHRLQRFALLRWQRQRIGTPAAKRAEDAYARTVDLANVLQRRLSR